MFDTFDNYKCLQVSQYCQHTYIFIHISIDWTVSMLWISSHLETLTNST